MLLQDVADILAAASLFEWIHYVYTEPTREGRTKLVAAVEAVRLFFDELDLPLDQAAVVQFNGGVELLQGQLLALARQ